MMERSFPEKINEKGWISLNSLFTNTELNAVFSLKSFSLDGDNGRREFANQVGFKSQNIIVPLQTHSNNVVFRPSKKNIENCDGVFTNIKNEVCSIQVADCMPLFFAHIKNIVFGIIHVGWRGLVNGIINQTADLLIKTGYHLNDFEIIIGPSIQDCCFEVRDDIVRKFNSEFVSNINDKKQYRIDLQSYALKNLNNIGFKIDNIKVMKECTYCDFYKYHSYRRDGEKAGRMIGLIGYK